MTATDTSQPAWKIALKIVAIVLCLYLFIVGVGGMGHAFKLFGADFAGRIISATSNPLTALFIGILATSLVQSSSTPTATALALYARYLKRIGAHSRNIVTSVVNPFPRLGYREKNSDA